MKRKKKSGWLSGLTYQPAWRQRSRSRASPSGEGSGWKPEAEEEQEEPRRRQETDARRVHCGLPPLQASAHKEPSGTFSALMETSQFCEVGRSVFPRVCEVLEGGRRRKKRSGCREAWAEGWVCPDTRGFTQVQPLLQHRRAVPGPAPPPRAACRLGARCAGVRLAGSRVKPVSVFRVWSADSISAWQTGTQPARTAPGPLPGDLRGGAEGRTAGRPGGRGPLAWKPLRTGPPRTQGFLSRSWESDTLRDHGGLLTGQEFLRGREDPCSPSLSTDNG